MAGSLLNEQKRWLERSGSLTLGNQLCETEEKGTSYGFEGISNMGPKSLSNMHTHITADVVASHGDKMFVRSGHKRSLGHCIITPVSGNKETILLRLL